MKSQINVGLVGFGTVGTGTAKILLENRDLIARRVGVPLALRRIVDLDLTTDRGIILPDGLLSSDLPGLLNDPEIDIVIELIGGFDTAKQVMLDAMAQGKHVVTANKALLAVHGEDVFGAAARAGLDLGFEASVGGGIPIVLSLIHI